MHLRGVNATTVDEILEAAGVGKGQFYHYFESRAELEAAVLEFHVSSQPEVRSSEAPGTWEEVDAWFDALYGLHEMHDFQGGCPLGAMASEVADRDAELRSRLDEAFRLKARYLARGLRALQERGELEASADPDALAEFVIAAAQGGLVLARTRQSGEPFRNALEHARGHLEAYRLHGPG